MEDTKGMMQFRDLFEHLGLVQMLQHVGSSDSTSDIGTHKCEHILRSTL